jgi:hypothetical protein
MSLLSTLFDVWHHSVGDVSCLREVGHRAPPHPHQHPWAQSVLEMASLDARLQPCWVCTSSALVSAIASVKVSLVCENAKRVRSDGEN